MQSLSGDFIYMLKSPTQTTCIKNHIRNDNFNPLAANNQLYTQGLLSEIKAFADMVELSGENLSSLSSINATYKLLSLLKQQS